LNTVSDQGIHTTGFSKARTMSVVVAQASHEKIPNRAKLCLLLIVGRFKPSVRMIWHQAICPVGIRFGESSRLACLARADKNIHIAVQGVMNQLQCTGRVRRH